MGLLKLTESERLEILNLHNNARIIKEQATSLVSSTAPASTAAPAQTVADVIKELQTLLNTKYGTKLTVDGKWGNLTQTAFETAMKSKAAPAAGTPAAGTPAAGTPAAGTPAAGTGTELPTVTVSGQKAPDPAIAAAPNVPLPSVATPAAPGVSGQPAPATPVTPAAPLSNRDQRRERQDLRRGNRRAMQDLRGQQRAQ